MHAAKCPLNMSQLVGHSTGVAAIVGFAPNNDTPIIAFCSESTMCGMDLSNLRQLALHIAAVT